MLELHQYFLGEQQISYPFHLHHSLVFKLLWASVTRSSIFSFKSLQLYPIQTSMSNYEPNQKTMSKNLGDLRFCSTQPKYHSKQQKAFILATLNTRILQVGQLILWIQQLQLMTLALALNGNAFWELIILSFQGNTRLNMFLDGLRPPTIQSIKRLGTPQHSNGDMFFALAIILNVQMMSLIWI